jgi:uncharacterized cupin superfamily protein
MSSRGGRRSGSMARSTISSQATGSASPRGTGSAHTFLNNTDADVRLLVIGEKSRPGCGIHYPLHPVGNAEIGARHWQDRPARPLGSHDGLPDRLRDKGYVDP